MKTNYEVNKKRMFHFRGIKAYYLPPTNYLGSRVALNDTRHKQRIYISWDYKLSDLKAIAINELNKRNIKVDGFTYDERSGEYTLLTRDFKTMLRR
jgi:hypothetical protein|tara:strand:- start:82 stop:369 length:288 start_codon:yes stop_codon:yes gene_type:complete